MGELLRYNGYCVKCKDRVNFMATAGWSPAKRWMAVGNCPHCGTKVNRLLPNPPGHSSTWE